MHRDLSRLVRRAIAITAMDFVVFDGRRSQAEQDALTKRGASWSGQTGSGIVGRHVSGHAVDLVPWLEGKPRWHEIPCRRIAVAMLAASRELAIPLRWGGTWKRLSGNPMTAPASRRFDGPHFELPRSHYDSPVHYRRIVYRMTPL